MRLTNKCPTRSLATLRFALPAQVVKLVDTLASGASARKGVEVQVLSWAPNFLPTLRVLRNLAHRSFCVEEDYFSYTLEALALVGSQRWNQKNEQSSRMASSDFSSAN